jgi:hypothetical protein
MEQKNIKYKNNFKIKMRLNLNLKKIGYTNLNTYLNNKQIDIKNTKTIKTLMQNVNNVKYTYQHTNKKY